MSHGHSHAPGQSCSHSDVPQSPVLPTPDPALQALIDQDFIPVPVALSSDAHAALCARHRLEKCDPCNVNFVNTNRLAHLLVQNPNLLCPPPNNVVTQKLTQMVVSTKDEGNNLFKAGHAEQALTRYTAAAQLAVQRPPWEANGLMREELTTVVSNRSAAYYDVQDYVSALADAETVIAIRRNWSKGHFRKAKALLGLHRLQESADAIRLGLSFEPHNAELLTFLADVERLQKKVEDKKQEARAAKTEPPSTPVAAAA